MNGGWVHVQYRCNKRLYVEAIKANHDFLDKVASWVFGFLDDSDDDEDPRSYEFELLVCKLANSTKYYEVQCFSLVCWQWNTIW